MIRSAKRVVREPGGRHARPVKRSTIAVMAAVAAVAAAGVYLPMLGAEFAYDDVAQIEIDDYIHKPAHFREVASFRVLGKDVLDGNRPVMLLSLMVDSMLWGRNPFGYHLNNLLLHAACSVLLFLLLVRIFRRLGSPAGSPIPPLLGALAGAVLFAVHPVASEAVCAVSFREDLLVAFLGLVGLTLAERFPARRRSTTLLLGAGCVLAIFAATACKESGAAVVVFVAAYWLIIRRAERWRSWAGLIAAGAAAVAVFLAARFMLAPEQSIIFTSKPSYLGGSFSAMLTVQPRIWAFQLSQIFWPNRLCAHQGPYTISHISLTVALVSLAIAGLVAAAFARKNRGVSLAAVFYLSAILPVSNLVPMFRPMADRYLYLPMVGVSVAVGSLLCRWKIGSRRRLTAAFVVVAAVVCVMLGAATVRRTLVWRDGTSLWTDAAAKNPYSSAIHNNLGFALFEDGEADKATRSFKRACRLNRDKADAWGGLAVTYEAMGKPHLAEQALRKAVSLDQRYADPPSLVKALIWKQNHAEKLQVVAERISEQQHH